MGFKENVNKIHSDLTSKYDVKIEEGQSKQGNFIKFSIKEDKKELLVSIYKSSLEKNHFDWVYDSNPLNENNDLVERSSTIDGFISDVIDIFEKNRFSDDYLKKLN
jgi:hypothetical protein